MKILVIGGTRFFGKNLVSALLEQKHDVTILSRGNNDIPHPQKTSHIKADRNNFTDALNTESHWDVVYDQICYCTNDAIATLEAIKNKTKKLIIASSEAVYPDGSNMKETNFDPYKFQYESGLRSQFTYAAGKQNAEAFLYQNAKIPVIAARIPFVFGETDYTNRLRSLIDAVKNKTPLYVPCPQASLSIIHETDIANALAALKEIDYNGPLNVAPSTPITVQSLLERIEVVVGTAPIIANNVSPESFSSDFFVPSSRSLNPELATNYGLQVPDIEAWLTPLIKAIHNQSTYH
jgi:nucleoside-diphosphate-sugar epimerase